jgi:hypothetical protein
MNPYQRNQLASSNRNRGTDADSVRLDEVTNMGRIAEKMRERITTRSGFMLVPCTPPEEVFQRHKEKRFVECREKLHTAY